MPVNNFTIYYIAGPGPVLDLTPRSTFFYCYFIDIEVLRLFFEGFIFTWQSNPEPDLLFFSTVGSGSSLPGSLLEQFLVISGFQSGLEVHASIANAYALCKPILSLLTKDARHLRFAI